MCVLVDRSASSNVIRVLGSRCPSQLLLQRCHDGLHVTQGRLANGRHYRRPGPELGVDVHPHLSPDRVPACGLRQDDRGKACAQSTGMLPTTQPRPTNNRTCGGLLPHSHQDDGLPTCQRVLF